MNSILMTLILLGLLVGCSLQPTKVYESRAGFTKVLESKSKQPIRLTDKTQVIDARTRFDFTMAHFPGAVHLRWESFSETKGRFPGRIKKDKASLLKKLQLKGLRPEKPTVVIGYGKKGEGESGRLGWTLVHLGFQDVQVISDSVLGLSSNVVQSKPQKNTKSWPPRFNKSLIAQRSEVLKAVASKKGRQKTFLIDVRSNDEYFKKKGFGQGYASLDLGAIHIHWTEFFTNRGRPNRGLSKKLRGIGITPQSRIILLSNKGVRSAAANLSLLSLGFKNSATYVDGLRGLNQRN